MSNELLCIHQRSVSPGWLTEIDDQVKDRMFTILIYDGLRRLASICGNINLDLLIAAGFNHPTRALSLHLSLFTALLIDLALKQVSAAAHQAIDK
ncbi:MAG: hypothetical protein AB2797_04315, partial [Candidatus Thiodiazotropha sp.]